MCEACGGRQLTKRRVLSKVEFSPEEERVFQTFLDDYIDAVQPVENDIEAFLDEASEEDLESLESLRGEIQQRAGDYTNDFEVVFRENGEDGILAGRELAVRQEEIDVAFDVVPDRTLDILDEWVDVAAGSTLETITEDSARWLRGAHKDGLSIPDIADKLNDELYDGRLEGYVAERAARTGTISTSNAGAHSAHEDADSVVGEQWLTSIDGRERDSHAQAHQQVVAVGTSFEVGGVDLDHPGDPLGPVSEIANCRCATAAVFADQLSESQLETIQNGGRVTVAI